MAIVQYRADMYKRHNAFVQDVGSLARVGAIVGHDAVKVPGVPDTCFSMIKSLKQSDCALQWIS